MKYFLTMEIVRPPIEQGGEERRRPISLGKGDHIVWEKGSNGLIYKVNGVDVEWRLYINLSCSADGYSRTPSTAFSAYTIPADVDRIRALLVLVVSGYHCGINEKDTADSVIWTIE